ncbi:hypothetical protein Barb7_03265 [Bacteroidales bacterium Barb7]|nr:hypothetical protein Barb7_03265 [Bacteroidales bacterium Barb7]
MKKTIVLTACLAVILAACKDNSNNGMEQEPALPEEQGDVRLYVTTNTRSLDFARKSVNFNEKVSNISPYPYHLKSGGTLPNDGRFRCSSNRFYLFQSVADETGRQDKCFRFAE